MHHHAQRSGRDHHGRGSGVHDRRSRRRVGHGHRDERRHHSERRHQDEQSRHGDRIRHCDRPLRGPAVAGATVTIEPGAAPVTPAPALADEALAPGSAYSLEAGASSPRSRPASPGAVSASAGEGCPKLGGTGECIGDCRSCSYRGA